VLAKGKKHATQIKAKSCKFLTFGFLITAAGEMLGRWLDAPYAQHDVLNFQMF
jgi:hypothetical protein